MDEMIFYPSRVHEDDIPPSKIIITNHSYKHLNLPCEPGNEIDREAALTWFHETWAKRLQTDVEPVIIVSRIHEGWIQKALDELGDIAKLEQDWDSYGADPPSPLAIAVASELLRIVDKKFGQLGQSQPQLVAPRADGGIQIEWGTQPIELAVHADHLGGLGYLYIDRQGDTPKFEEVSTASWSEVLRLVAKIVANPEEGQNE